MNDELAMIMMSRLLHLDYIEKFGGIVQTKIKTDSRVGSKERVQNKLPTARVFRRFKASDDPLQCDREEIVSCGLKSNIIEPFLPESKLKGMIYFEDQGVQPDTGRRHTSLNFFRSTLRLVGWFNQKRLSNEFDNAFRSKAISEIVSHITRRYRNTELIKMMDVSFDGIPELDASIFSEYDFNEAQTQFLTEKYDFFAINFEVTFAMSKKCFVPFKVEQTNNC